MIDMPSESHEFDSEMIDMDQQWMRRAIAYAQQAMELDEVPVGAVITLNQRVIGAGWNQREQLQDPTAHAEMIAITQASASLSSWRLQGCTLYVTLEPCPMCAGAIIQSRIERVVYGASDPKAGAVNSLYQLLTDPRLNHRCQVTGGVMAGECGALLSHFFQAQRKLGKK
jgi:tRNA(adenine34) deaminase